MIRAQPRSAVPQFWAEGVIAATTETTDGAGDLMDPKSAVFRPLWPLPDRNKLSGPKGRNLIPTFHKYGIHRRENVEQMQ